jgi:hypothetical protein
MSYRTRSAPRLSFCQAPSWQEASVGEGPGGGCHDTHILANYIHTPLSPTRLEHALYRYLYKPIECRLASPWLLVEYASDGCHFQKPSHKMVGTHLSLP